MLQDQLVYSIGDERWQKHLLSEEKLTYDQAVKILQALETAEQDVKDLATPKSSIHQISSRSSIQCGVQWQNPALESAAAYSASPTCYHCGGPHKTPKCCLKDALCATTVTRSIIFRGSAERRAGHQKGKLV